MTTRIVVSVPFIHQDDEVYIKEIYGEEERELDIIREVGVKEYTLWRGKSILVGERASTK